MMREINRRDEILKLLDQIWTKFPDWRLGQILVNATGETGDMFYIEDDRLIKDLKELKKIWNIE